MRTRWAGVRRRSAEARLRALARTAGARLDLSVASTARLGHLDVRFAPGARARLHVGEHTTIDDGVEIRFRGDGSVRIGDWSELRRDVRIVAAGDVVLDGQNLLSWGVVLHCDEGIALHRQAVLSEHVSVTDSVHDHAEGEWHLDRLRTAPVVIGTDTWVGAKATITHGVTVGAHCVVGAGAVVTRDVPDHHAALGVPARPTPLHVDGPAGA